jgi:anti-anti-sigma factor
MTGLEVEPLESERGFRLRGELDVDTYSILKAALEPELRGTIVLDLTALEYMEGDAGLGVLAWVIHTIGKKGGTLVLRNPLPAVRRAFEVTGLVALPGLRFDPQEPPA